MPLRPAVATRATRSHWTNAATFLVRRGEECRGAGMPVGRSAERTLPDRVTDEEGAERLQILRGLGSLAHRLHQVRQRMQLAPAQTDDEVVVVDVQAVAGQSHVVGKVGL